jgi:8-oxo-dGTP pyrophosphatase MutT (NUDIX family)
MSNNKKKRAGMIPYYVFQDGLKILTMKPSDPKYGGPDFQFAKGIIDPGETNEEAAVREATEELGIIPTNMKNIQFLGTYTGNTFYYTCEVINPDALIPYHFETGDICWMTPEEFMDHGRDIQRCIIPAFNKYLQTKYSIIS